MTEEEQFQEDTERLRLLISQVDNSGISAWDAGDLLKYVKDRRGYIQRFGTFENYTKSEIGINPQTANNYINIREKFTREEIGKLMLVTHLRVIAEIENSKMRKLVLDSINKREENQQKAPQDQIYKTKLADIIGTVTMVLESGNTDLKENEIHTLLELNIEKGKEEEQKRKRAKRKQKGTDGKDKFGNRFESKYFKDISALLENEPINEMGVVALFCLMFQSMRGTQFDWGIEKVDWGIEKVTFIAIKYIRAEFPDASIRCKTTSRTQRNFELQIEFEFESYNYIRHKHMQSSKTCDLIVCWDDNAKTDLKLKNTEAVKKMPPVLSLKNCFETGEIKLLT